MSYITQITYDKSTQFFCIGLHVQSYLDLDN